MLEEPIPAFIIDKTRLPNLLDKAVNSCLHSSVAELEKLYSLLAQKIYHHRSAYDRTELLEVSIAVFCLSVCCLLLFLLLFCNIFCGYHDVKTGRGRQLQNICCYSLIAIVSFTFLFENTNFFMSSKISVSDFVCLFQEISEILEKHTGKTS